MTERSKVKVIRSTRDMLSTTYLLDMIRHLQRPASAIEADCTACSTFNSFKMLVTLSVDDVHS